MKSFQDELTEILQDVYLAGWHDTAPDYESEELKSAQSQLNKLLLDEVEKLRTVLRGEDPDQYRPNDLIAMSLVEEALDETIKALGVEDE